MTPGTTPTRSRHLQGVGAWLGNHEGTGAVANCFVSHASKDRNEAELLHQRLRAAGHRVFLDTDHDDGIQPGEGWEARLGRELTLADAVIFVNSPAAQASAWCLYELQRAKERQLRIYSVAVSEDVAPYGLIAQAQGVTGPTFEDRVQRAVGMVDELNIASWNPERSPYPGLAAFEPEDEAIFFGRTEDIAYLRKLLGPDDPANGQRLLMMGPSGVGKSSLVRAGLLPSLRRHPGWRVVTPRLVPPDLLASVHDALRDAGGGTTGTIVERAREIVRRLPPPARLLLVVDQAEDLLLPDVDEARRDALVAELKAATASHSPVSTLVSFREDRLAEMKTVLPHFIESGVTTALVVNRMPAARVTELIEGPARVHGLTLDPGLAARLRDDAGGGDERVHALPLIAFTLSEMYRLTKERDDHRLTVRDYEQVGEFKGAIATAASKTEARIADGAALDSLLVQLVSVNEQGTVASRTLPASALDPRQREVAEVLADDRLLSLSQGDHGEPTVRLVHDRLASDWPRLRQLVELRSDDLRMQARLERQAREFTEGQRDVLPPEATKEARDWLARQPLNAPLESVRALVSVSRRRHRRRRAVWQTTGAVVAVLGLLAVAFAVQSKRQEQNTKVLGFSINAQSYASGGQPFAALANAYDSVRAGWNERAEQAMRQSLAQLGSARHLGLRGTVSDLAWSPDGTIAFVVSGMVSLWNPARGQQVTPLTDQALGYVTALAYNRDGSRLAMVANLGRPLIWDRASGSLTSSTETISRRVGSLSFTPDGTKLVAAGDHDVVVMDVSAARSRKVAAPDDWVLRAVSHDGSRAIAVRPDDKVSVLDLTGESAAPIADLPGVAHVSEGAFSEDDLRVGVFDGTGAAKVFQLGQGAPVLLSAQREGPVLDNAFAFGRDLREAAVITPDKAIGLLDVETGSVSTLSGTIGPTTSAIFSPDGDWLAALTADDRAFVSNTHTGATTDLGTARADGPRALAFDADGRRLAIAGAADDLLVFDLPTIRPTTLPGDGTAVDEMTFSDDGNVLATTDLASTITVWDIRTGAGQQVEPDEFFDSISLDAAGRTLVALDAQGQPMAWDITGEPKRVPTGSSAADSIAISPDGRLIATGGSGGVVTLYDHESQQSTTLAAGGGGIASLRFDPSGERLLIEPTSAPPLIWAHGGDQILRPPPVDRFGSTLWVASDRNLAHVVIATALSDGPAEFAWWDVVSGTTTPWTDYSGFGGRLADNGDLFFDASTDPPELRSADGRPVRYPLVAKQPAVAYAFDVANGRVLMSLRNGSIVLGAPGRPEAAVVATNAGTQSSMAFSPTGDLFATARADGSIRLWNDAYLIGCDQLWQRAQTVLGEHPSTPPTSC